jgi:hypothetical protein
LSEEVDWLGRWFIILEELGDDVGVRFGRAAGDALAWTAISHRHVDGIGGLAKLVREEGLPLDRLPGLTRRRDASALAKTAAMLRYFFVRPRRAARWRGQIARQEPFRPGEGAVLAAAVLREAETAHVTAKAKDAGVSVNTWLLWHLDRVTRASVDEATGRPQWMVPVNMRGAAFNLRDTANHSSYVLIDVSETATPTALHERIVRAMDHDDHWAGWVGLTLGRYVGMGGMRVLWNLDRVLGRTYTASFSNLGSWQVPEASPDVQWVFAPPVGVHLPFAAGAITWNQRLALSVHLHGAMGRTQSDAETFLERWRASLAGN